MLTKSRGLALWLLFFTDFSPPSQYAVCCGPPEGTENGIHAPGGWDADPADVSFSAVQEVLGLSVQGGPWLFQPSETA